MAVTKRRTRPAIKAAAREVGQEDLRHVAYGLAPHIDLPIIPLPEARLEEFVAHLTAVIDESFEATEAGGRVTVSVHRREAGEGGEASITVRDASIAGVQPASPSVPRVRPWVQSRR